MEREPTPRSRGQLPPRTGSDLNLHWMEKGPPQATRPTKGKHRAINKRTWLDPSIDKIMGLGSSKRCFLTPEDSRGWWPKAKVWTQANSSRLVDTHQASQNGSKDRMARMDKTSKWHKCSTRCNSPPKATSREKVPTPIKIIDKLILINKEIILFV